MSTITGKKVYSKEELFHLNVINGSPITVHFNPKSPSLRDNGETKTVLKLLLDDQEKERLNYNISNQNRTYGLIKCLAINKDSKEKEIAFHTNDVKKIELRSAV